MKARKPYYYCECCKTTHEADLSAMRKHIALLKNRGHVVKFTKQGRANCLTKLIGTN